MNPVHDAELLATIAAKTHGPKADRLRVMVGTLRDAGGDMPITPEVIKAMAAAFEVKAPAVRKAIATLVKKGIAEIYTQPRQRMLRFCFSPSQFTLPMEFAFEGDAEGTVRMLEAAD